MYLNNFKIKFLLYVAYIKGNKIKKIIVLLLIAGITVNMAAKQVGIFKPKTHQGQSVVITNKVNTTNTTNTTNN